MSFYRCSRLLTSCAPVIIGLVGCGQQAAGASDDPTQRPQVHAVAVSSTTTLAPYTPAPPASEPMVTETHPATLSTHQPSQPRDVLPPPATLEIHGVQQTSGIGSYCWSEGGRGVCADAIGIATPLEPLVTHPRASARLHLPLAQAPIHVQLHIHSMVATDELPTQARGYRWWNFKEDVFSDLPLNRVQTIKLPHEPGLYVVCVSVWWDTFGDAMYGFLVEVRE